MLSEIIFGSFIKFCFVLSYIFHYIKLMSAPIVQGKIPNRHGPARACGVVVSVKTATHINSDIIPA